MPIEYVDIGQFEKFNSHRNIIFFSFNLTWVRFLKILEQINSNFVGESICKMDTFNREEKKL